MLNHKPYKDLNTIDRAFLYSPLFLLLYLVPTALALKTGIYPLSPFIALKLFDHIAVCGSLFALLALTAVLIFQRTAVKVLYLAMPMVILYGSMFVLVSRTYPHLYPSILMPIYAWQAKSFGVFFSPHFMEFIICLGCSLIVYLLLPSPLKPRMKTNRYGKAKWASAPEVYEMGLCGNRGQVLGKFHGSLLRSDKPLSTLLLAPPGTGKTAGFVVANLCVNDNSMVIYDKKGELYAKTAEARKQLGSTVLVFDPTSTNSITFNVLSKRLLPSDSSRLQSYLENIAKLIILTDKSEPFFSLAAQRIFVFFSLLLLEEMDGYQGDISIAQVRERLFRETNLIVSIKEVAEGEEYSEDLRVLANEIVSLAGADKTWGCIMGVISNSLSVFSEPYVRKVTSGSDSFYPERLREEKVSLFIRVSENDSERLAPIVRLFYCTIARELISREPTPIDQPVTFLIDEFARLERTDYIARLPEISRGYGLNLILIAQDYGQIRSIYGEDMVQILNTNCEYKIILRQNNVRTAKEISEMIGKHTDLRTTLSRDARSLIQRDRGENISEEGIALVSEQDILSLGKTECIVLVGGYADKPVKAEIPFG